MYLRFVVKKSVIDKYETDKNWTICGTHHMGFHEFPINQINKQKLFRLAQKLAEGIENLWNPVLRKKTSRKTHPRYSLQVNIL